MSAQPGWDDNSSGQRRAHLKNQRKKADWEVRFLFFSLEISPASLISSTLNYHLLVPVNSGIFRGQYKMYPYNFGGPFFGYAPVQSTVTGAASTPSYIPWASPSSSSTWSFDPTATSKAEAPICGAGFTYCGYSLRDHQSKSFIFQLTLPPLPLSTDPN